MSYRRMKQAEAALGTEVAAWLERAAAADAADDTALGADQRGDELPAWVRAKQQRLAKSRAAKAALEADAARAPDERRDDPPPHAPRPGAPPQAPPRLTPTSNGI